MIKDERFNLCDKDGNLKDVPKLNLNYGGRFDKLIDTNNGFKFANDCNDAQVMIVINFISISKISDKDKRTLIQQFLLNWLCINTIKISIDSLKGC